MVGVHDPNTTRELVLLSARVGAEVRPLGIQVRLVIGLVEDIFFDLVEFMYRVALVVFLEHYKEVCLGMDLDLARRVPRFEDVLGKLLTDVLDRYDAEGVFRDCHDALRASQRAERGYVSERLVTKRRDSVVTHVVVA